MYTGKIVFVRLKKIYIAAVSYRKGFSAATDFLPIKKTDQMQVF